MCIFMVFFSYYNAQHTAVCVVYTLQHCLNIKTQLFVNKLYRNSFDDDIRLRVCRLVPFHEMQWQQSIAQRKAGQSAIQPAK